MQRKCFNFIGDEILTLTNERGSPYPKISVKDFVNSYFKENETGIKPVEFNHWFFPAYDLKKRKREQLIDRGFKITHVSKENSKSDSIYVYGPRGEKTWVVQLVEPGTLLVRNYLSKKILYAPFRLIDKWAPMFQVAVIQNDKLVFQFVDIKKYDYNDMIYSIHMEAEDGTQVIANNLII